MNCLFNSASFEFLVRTSPCHSPETRKKTLYALYLAAMYRAYLLRASISGNKRHGNGTFLFLSPHAIASPQTMPFLFAKLTRWSISCQYPGLITCLERSLNGNPPELPHPASLSTIEWITLKPCDALVLISFSAPWRSSFSSALS